MADVSQDQGGTPPRRPVLRPFSGVRGAGQGPLKPLGARRLAVSPFPVLPDVGPQPAESAGAASALPVSDAGTSAVALAAPYTERPASVVEVDSQPEADVLDAIASSDPAAVPLDTCPESALDLASLADREIASSPWEGEEIAYGSAVTEPAPPSAHVDQEVPEIEAVDTLEAVAAAAELSLEPSAGAMAIEGAEAFAEVLPVVEAGAGTVATPVEIDGSELASDAESVALVHVVDALVAAPVELDATSSMAEEATAWLEQESNASIDWNGESESVSLDVHEPSGDVVDADATDALHTSHADVETACGPTIEPVVAEIAAPLLDVELKGFHLKPEEVLEVPAPIPGFEHMIAEPSPADGEEAPIDVAAEAEELAVASAPAEPAVSIEGEGVLEEEVISLRVASAPPETLAQGDADLQEFVARTRSQAHVLETLEAVARRVRGGEIVPTTDAGASPEAVLASVLASLLSARP